MTNEMDTYPPCIKDLYSTIKNIDFCEMSQEEIDKLPFFNIPKTAGGMYMFDTACNKHMVCINKDLSIVDKIVASTHEFGHVKCSANECSCLHDDAEGEIHAFNFSLQFLLEQSLYEPLGKTMILVLQRMRNGLDGDTEQLRIAISIMVPELWRQCWDAVGDSLIERIIKTSDKGKCILKLLGISND